MYCDSNVFSGDKQAFPCSARADGHVTVVREMPITITVITISLLFKDAN